MLTLHRSLDGDLTAGEALPPVYRSLEEAEIRFYRSALHMSVGRPGGGKSIFALNHAIKAKVPTLYFSCDMSRFTFAARAAAIITGESARSVKELVSTTGGREKYRAALKSVNHLFLACEKRPGAEEMEETIEAFTERWGVPPELIVVDNMTNLLPSAADEWSGLREMSHVLDYFAAELGSCVHMLHHINLGGQRLDEPGDMASVKGKIVELPSLILSIAKTERELRWAAVKNREGSEDPMAQNWKTLELEPASMALRDPVRPVTPFPGTSYPNTTVSPSMTFSAPYRGNSAMDLMVND
jgi:hypothetical protein